MIQAEKKVTVSKEKSAQWNDRNDPDRAGDDLVYTFSDLPLSGETAVTPWPGSYWPAYKDSINYRWEGSRTDSPAKKYQKAFEPSENIEDLVSRARGIDRNWNVSSCRSDLQCSSDSKCAKRYGDSVGKCIPKWYGICHAWAPAAIAEKEPKKPVVYNGVEFKVNDLKALVSFSYTKGVNYKLLGARCYSQFSQLSYTASGSPVRDECADSNAGSFHVVAANLIGLQKRSFIEDRTGDLEVWNQPVRSFQVTYNREVSSGEANEIAGFAGVDSTEGLGLASLNLQESFKGEVSKNQWKKIGIYPVSEGDQLFAKMTGTGDADLYIRFDQTPELKKYDCRPYINSSREECQLGVPEGVEDVYVYVRGYSDLSSYELNLEIKKQGDGQLVNTKGKVVKGEWHKIGEFDVQPGQKITASMTGSGDADLYVKIDGKPNLRDYDCRPYLNSSNETCRLVISAGQQKAHVYVAGYADSSNYDISVSVASREDNRPYVPNPDAVYFRHIKMSLKYVKESPDELDGYLTPYIGRYLGTDLYEYILELDANGKIIGGEWVGQSKTNHPDFFWFPSPKKNATVAGIEWAKVKMLLDMSTDE